MSTSVETTTTPRSSLPNAISPQIAAREIDFVTRFGQNWQSLMEVYNITRPIRKAPGTKLVSYTTSVDLEDGDVPEGAVIPYSKAIVTPVTYGDVALEKYAKAVTIEDVNKYGATVAIEKTDNAFLTELQSKVTDKLYKNLNADEEAIEVTGSNLQQSIAKCIGAVKNKFKKLHKDVSEIVVFVNIQDVYDYLGNGAITTQILNGTEYLKNFLGASTVILGSEDEIARGKVIATPSENLDLYYIDPDDGDFKKLGLDYRTAGGQTNLIGFHAQGNYNTAVGESYAIMGMTLWYEQADGVAIGTFSATTGGTTGGNTGGTTEGA